VALETLARRATSAIVERFGSTGFTKEPRFGTDGVRTHSKQFRRVRMRPTGTGVKPGRDALARILYMRARSPLELSS